MVAKFHPSDLSSTFKCPDIQSTVIQHGFKAICNRMWVKQPSSVAGSVNLAVSAAQGTQAWWRRGHTSGAPTCWRPSTLPADSFLARNALRPLPWEILGDFHLKDDCWNVQKPLCFHFWNVRWFLERIQLISWKLFLFLLLILFTRNTKQTSIGVDKIISMHAFLSKKSF